MRRSARRFHIIPIHIIPTSISTRAAIAVATLLTCAATLEAAEFHLSDGRRILGCYIGEADGQVEILTESGDRDHLDKSTIQWVDWHKKLSKARESEASRRRARFTKERRRQAKALMRKVERAKPDDRAALTEKLDGFQESDLIPAFDKALRSKDEQIRELALTRLDACKSPGAIVPLINTALRSADRAFAARSHAQALSRNRDLSRRLYEYAALAAPAPQQLLALDAIAGIGDRASAPRLVEMMVYVDANIRAQLARTKQIRKVPMNLGQGVHVEVELPEIELIEVMTSTRAPVQVLRRVQRATAVALKAVTGEDFGNDAERWKGWLATQDDLVQPDAKKKARR